MRAGAQRSRNLSKDRRSVSRSIMPQDAEINLHVSRNVFGRPHQKTAIPQPAASAKSRHGTTARESGAVNRTATATGARTTTRRRAHLSTTIVTTASTTRIVRLTATPGTIRTGTTGGRPSIMRGTMVGSAIGSESENLIVTRRPGMRRGSEACPRGRMTGCTRIGSRR